MGKPWARYEIGFINHPKFRALNPNAICLWWECKNYCDEFLNDGIVPKSVAKGFRFYSTRAMELLTRSCGVKPNTEPYAPLWEGFDLGGVAHIRMHDYLDHNDCRDAVLARIEKADLRKDADRERKAVARSAKETKAACVRADKPADNHADMYADTGADRPADTPADTLRNPRNVRVYTETPTETQTLVPTEQERGRRPPPPSARSGRPIFKGRKLTVFEWMLDDLLRLLDPHGEAFDLHEWFFTLDQRCVERGESPPERDGGVWLKAVTLTEAQRRGLPLRTAEAPEQRFGKQTTRLMQAVANIKRESQP